MQASVRCKACRTLCWVYDRLKILQQCAQLFQGYRCQKEKKNGIQDNSAIALHMPEQALNTQRFQSA